MSLRKALMGLLGIRGLVLVTSLAALVLALGQTFGRRRLHSVAAASAALGRERIRIAFHGLGEPAAAER